MYIYQFDADNPPRDERGTIILCSRIQKNNIAIIDYT